MKNIKIGSKFKAKSNNNNNQYKLIGINSKGYYILKAINETLKQLEYELNEFKKHNGYYEDIKNITIDEFSTMEVEQEWFNQRKITLLEV